MLLWELMTLAEYAGLMTHRGDKSRVNEARCGLENGAHAFGSIVRKPVAARATYMRFEPNAAGRRPARLTFHPSLSFAFCEDGHAYILSAFLSLKCVRLYTADHQCMHEDLRCVPQRYRHLIAGAPSPPPVANNCQPGAFIRALQDLGTGGV